MELKKYKRKPIFADAIQVTEENMWELAKFCGGDIILDYEQTPPSRCIRITSGRGAYIGDWILESVGDTGNYFSACPDEDFQELFEIR